MALDPLRFGAIRTMKTDEAAGEARQPMPQAKKPIGTAMVQEPGGVVNPEIQNDDALLPYQKL